MLRNLKMNSNLENRLTSFSFIKKKKGKGKHRLKRLPGAGLICKNSNNTNMYYIKAKVINICTAKCIKKVVHTQ